MWLYVFLLLGFIFGSLLVFNHSSTKNKTIVVKIILSLLTGFGSAVLLNSIWNLADLSGLR